VPEAGEAGWASVASVDSARPRQAGKHGGGAGLTCSTSTSCPSHATICPVRTLSWNSASRDSSAPNRRQRRRWARPSPRHSDSATWAASATLDTTYTAPRRPTATASSCVVAAVPRLMQSTTTPSEGATMTAVTTDSAVQATQASRRERSWRSSAHSSATDRPAVDTGCWLAAAGGAAARLLLPDAVAASACGTRRRRCRRRRCWLPTCCERSANMPHKDTSTV
jgi:hypothetical protein